MDMIWKGFTPLHRRAWESFEREKRDIQASISDLVAGAATSFECVRFLERRDPAVTPTRKWTLARPENYDPSPSIAIGMILADSQQLARCLSSRTAFTAGSVFLLVGSPAFSGRLQL